MDSLPVSYVMIDADKFYDSYQGTIIVPTCR